MPAERGQTIADMASEFVRRATAGEHVKVRVRKNSAELFIGELVRAGLRLAEDCLEFVKDPDLREIIRAVLGSAAAGAVLGAAVGSLTGPQGAKVGAVIGAGVGVAVGVFAVLVRFKEESGRSGPELVVEANLAAAQGA